MNLILVGGFLGSGKTTGILAACQLLQAAGKTVAVITNDQGDEQVDYAYMKSFGIRSEEVSHGCFCCNYHQLDEHIRAFTQTATPDFIFAEAVGSCTDLLATVVRPLRKFNPDIRVTHCVFADAELLIAILEGRATFISESVRYIFKKQLEEAFTLIISKVDRVSFSQMEQLNRLLVLEYPHKRFIFQNSLDISGLQPWLNLLQEDNMIDVPSPPVDYQIYGRGEAELAWVDKSFVLRSVHNDATFIARRMIGRIFDELQQRRMIIGHLKFFLETPVGSQKISFTTTATTSSVNVILGATNEINVTINARIQAGAAELLQIVDDAIVTIQRQFGCKVESASTAAFVPGFPKPSYRMEHEKN